MIKVMFVCLGNICRSPLAEGIFKRLVQERNLQNKFYVESSGTSSYHIGSLPDPRTIDVASKYYTNLDHRAQQLVSEHLVQFDYVIAMDEKNFADVNTLKNSMKGKASGKILLMREFDEDKMDRNVPDPYFGQADGFDTVYHMLWRACTNFLDYLIKEHNLL